MGFMFLTNWSTDNNGVVLSTFQLGLREIQIALTVRVQAIDLTLQSLAASCSDPSSNGGKPVFSLHHQIPEFFSSLLF